MPKPMVYVAGPYGDAGGYTAIDKNISVARDACRWLAENEFFFLCPHMNSAHFEVITPDIPVEHWYEQDLRLLSMCDAMVLVGNWPGSKGVQREVAIASSRGMPTFAFEDAADMKRLNEWRVGWVSQPERASEAS